MLRSIILLSLVIIIGLIFPIGCSLFTSNTPSSSSLSPQSTAASQLTDTNLQPGTPSTLQAVKIDLPSFADLIATVERSVVKIDVISPATNIFGVASPQQGAGSGWIMDSNGLIVTANHVIEGATSITITTIDGKTYPAQLVNGDAKLDVAVLRINASQLPVLSIGDTSKIRAGDWVLAVGNPLGAGIIATQGIISRLGVDVPISSTQTAIDMIETTAAINPGNSGGALVNLSGEVIGITSIKVSASGIEGMGYAINMGVALPVIRQITK